MLWKNYYDKIKTDKKKLTKVKIKISQIYKAVKIMRYSH